MVIEPSITDTIAQMENQRLELSGTQYPANIWRYEGQADDHNRRVLAAIFKDYEDAKASIQANEKTITTLTKMLKDTEQRVIELERGFEGALRAVELNKTNGEWYAESN